ncbi:MAG: GH3 auxin-responsive promoter family protein [Phycisphaerales bacterium]
MSRRRRKLANTEWWRRNTARVQLRQLDGLLSAGMFCRYGRDHHYERILGMPDSVDRYTAFAEAVPVQDWYVFKDGIAEMREGGKRGVLWPGLVTRFAQTSGTTAGDKFIPVSDEMMKSNYLASLDIFSHLINRGAHPARLMGGRCLFLGGSSDLEYNEHGIATGDLSGLVTPLIKWPLSKIYSPGPEIALMSDWPAKIDAMAEKAIDQDIRFISGMPSWALVLVDRVIELARERGQSVTCARDVWPNLEVFVHGGVNYKPFVQRMCRAFSGDPAVDFPCRQELYPASEGFIAMQDTTGDPGMRLLSDIGTFYEFVPLENIDDDSPPAFPCWAVEKGQKYVVVMTTNAGLWRYVIGDVVEFDHVPAGPDGKGGDGPCRLRIVGRHRHFINAFGENLIVEHIEHGVAQASHATGIEHGEFTAAPVYPSEMNRAGLELAIEMPAGVSEADAAKFGEVFDAAVKAVNVDYTTKRSDSLGMTEPTITPVAMGAFHRWLDANGKLGGQHKCPRCANHREIVEAVASFGASSFSHENG